MVGRDNMVTDKNNESVWNHVTPPECSSNPSILRLASNNSWVLENEPQHADIDVTKAKVCGVGHGMSFANHLLKRDPVVGVIGLVPRTYATLRASDGGQIRALLWYQGESEAKGKSYPSPFATTNGPYVKDVRKFQLELKLPLLSMAFAAGSHSFKVVPPIAHGTKPITPTAGSLFNRWLANAIPGPTPHTLALVTSMSACRGSSAGTQELLDANFSIDGLGKHSGGVT
nr:probable carbohydrate esterase At4g34215 [Ipomoea batatas]